MCVYCTEGERLLIESTKISNMIYYSVGQILNREDLDEDDNSVVIEVRNGRGYIRLGDRSDMGCLDHSDNIKINYCPMCGKEFKEDD